MCSTAVRPAAQHAQSLMRQGKTKSAALDHAVQRYGVTRGAILREIRSWHEFTLPAEDESVPSDADLTLDYFTRLHSGLV